MHNMCVRFSYIVVTRSETSQCARTDAKSLLRHEFITLVSGSLLGSSNSADGPAAWVEARYSPVDSLAALEEACNVAEVQVIAAQVALLPVSLPNCKYYTSKCARS